MDHCVCVHAGIARADLALAPSWPNARRGRGRPLGSKGVEKVRIRTKVRRDTVTDGDPVTVTGNGADSMLALPGGTTLCVPGQR